MIIRSIVLLLLLIYLKLMATVVNPIIDTDKSINMYSIQTIHADLIKPGMTNQQKIDALFSFHRRMMHHYRMEQGTEDNISDFDIVKVYNVYGCGWCTQQAVIFRALLEPLVGYGNVRVAGSEGPLKTSGAQGGHSSFEFRFNSADSWHWVDPIIGAYAFNKTNGAIASLSEIKNDHSILSDAVKDGRASNPYFSCTHGIKSTTNDIAEAYAYFDYDTAFMGGFAEKYNGQDVSWARQSAMFTMAKNLRKGETYHWLWDYIDIDNHNIQDMTYAHINGKLTRDWKWYPPRHLCGDKDSMDTKNWPYFKPYAKFIKDRVSYRYFANGIHTFEPDLKTRDAFDGITPPNASFFFNDFSSPEIRPTFNDSTTVVAYKIKLPYPLMNLDISGEYTRTTNEDSVAIVMSQLIFNPKYSYYGRYLDTLSNEKDSLIVSLPVAVNGTFTIPLRNFVDPLYRNMYQTYYGYNLKLVIKSKNRTQDAGFHKIKAVSVFQHNMSALPQLEPGKNEVYITSSSNETNLKSNKMEVSFSWLDSGVTRNHIHRAVATKDTYDITVNQSEMPKMVSMTLSNKSDTAFDNISVEKRLFPENASILSASPNPFNPVIRIHGVNRGTALTIYSLDGKAIANFSIKDNDHSILWNAKGMPSGIYIAKLRDNVSSKSIRLFLTR